MVVAKKPLILACAPFLGAILMSLLYSPESQSSRKPRITTPPDAQPSAQRRIPKHRRPFRRFVSEELARNYCASQPVVWADMKLKIYYPPEAPIYGRTKFGAYMCEKDSLDAGFRPVESKQNSPSCCDQGRAGEKPRSI